MIVGKFDLNVERLIPIVVHTLVELAECDAWVRSNIRAAARSFIMREIQDNGALTEFISQTDRCWVSFQIDSLPKEQSVIDEVLRRFHEKVSVLDLMAWEALAWDDAHLMSLWNGSSSTSGPATA